MSISYAKPWLPIPDQLEKLRSRGLIIEDVSDAENFLRHLNYYRFAGYGLAFESARHTYIPGTTFGQIREAYEFDRALRDLFTESIEIIELDLRTNIAHAFSQKYGAFGHADSRHFHGSTDHRGWTRKLHDEARRSKEPFIDHYKTTYSEFPDLPLWVATEVMSFGALSRMFEMMDRPDQKPIAARYRMQPLTLESCIHHLVYVRNLCAHHSRLWDRVWAIKPSLPAGNLWQPPQLPGNDRIFASLLIQSALLRHMPAEAGFAMDWKRRVETLLTHRLPSCPNALNKMGLSTGWVQHKVWL